jgi:hypothetical protein
LTVLFPAGWARKIYVGHGGDVKVAHIGDAGVVYVAVPTGVWMLGVFTKVFHTGTTATNLVVEE